LFHQDATLVDMHRDPEQATGTEGLYQVLPLGETFELGPRSVNERGEVTWTEKVLQPARPTRESNLDVLMDDIARERPVWSMPNAAEMSVTQATSMSPQSTSYTRALRGTIVQSKIRSLAITPNDSPQASLPHPNARSAAIGYWFRRLFFSDGW
jgi:hypothetical protein